MKSKQRWILFTGTVLLSLPLHACGSTTLTRHTQALADQSNGSAAKVANFYDKLQAVHADLRTREIKLQVDASTEIDPAKPEALCPFSSEHVASRVKAAAFVEKLYAVINNVAHQRSPNEMQAALNDAKSQLSDYSFKNFNPLAVFQSATAPVSTGAKILGRRVMNIYTEKGLKSIINDSAEALKDQSKILQLELNADAKQTVTRLLTVRSRTERVYKNKVDSNAPASDIEKLENDLKTQLPSLKKDIESSNPSSIYESLMETQSVLLQSIAPSGKNTK